MPAQCPPRLKMLEKPLAFTNKSGGVVGPVGVPFTVRNPSVRLHCTLYVYARPDRIGLGGGNGGGPVDYTGETWQLYALSDSTPEQTLNWVFDVSGSNTARALPDSYEFETGIKVILGVVTLQKNVTNGPFTYWVRAVWEPAAGGTLMSDDERADLFALCELTTNSVVLALSC